MSLAEEAVYARLTGVPAIAALIGTRVYPALAPMGATLPYVVYQHISGVRETAFGDDPGIARARIQVAAWSDEYSEARQVAEAVRQGLQRYRGTVGGVEVLDVFVEADFDQYDEEALRYGAILDYQVIHREA